MLRLQPDKTVRYHRLAVKVFVGAKKFHHNFKPLPGNSYGETEIDDLLDKIVDIIDAKFPYIEFDMVRLKSAKHTYAVNYVAKGNRAGVNVMEILANAAKAAGTAAAKEIIEANAGASVESAQTQTSTPSIGIG